MAFLLRLKAWQLFMLTWGIIIIINAASLYNPDLIIDFFPITMFILAIGTFGWIYAMATELRARLPAGVNLNIKRFKILFAIACIYMIILTTGLGFLLDSSKMEEDISITLVAIGFIHLVAVSCLVYCIRFAAKTMRSVELGRLAKFNDYVSEFFLITFSIVGHWIIQPRLNKIMDASTKQSHHSSFL